MEILNGDRIFALNADKNNIAEAIGRILWRRRQTKDSFVTVVLQAKLDAAPLFCCWLEAITYNY
jgi:hypothetical protein